MSDGFLCRQSGPVVGSRLKAGTTATTARHSRADTPRPAPSAAAARRLDRRGRRDIFSPPPSRAASGGTWADEWRRRRKLSDHGVFLWAPAKHTGWDLGILPAALRR